MPSPTPTDPRTWEHERVLAPLTRGGNLPFRRLCVDYGATVTYSEMAFAHQLLRGSAKERALLRRHDSEACFVAQIAGNKAGKLADATKMAVDEGADVVDLNCGCPIHDVTRRGMGAALLQRPSRLGRLLEAMVEAVDKPVTVKIRTGYREEKINVHEVCRLAEEAGVAAIAIHGRTRDQRYSRAADWELVGAVAAERSVPIVGNGDVSTWYEAEDRRASSGVTNLMLARGALNAPWLFQEIAEGRDLLLDGPARLAVVQTYVRYAKEHFGDDEKGRKKAMYFVPWHLGMWCRYRPSPAADWRAASQEHPLLQTRREDAAPTSLEEALQSRDVRIHQTVADLVWDHDASAGQQPLIDAIVALELPQGEDIRTRKHRSPEG